MHRPARAPDWQDTHAGPVRSDLRTARAAFEAGFAHMPGWVEGALRFRDAIVGRFGLTRASNGALSMTDLPVIAEDDLRYEVGLPDKHLSFTIETALAPAGVEVTTRIWFHHWAGRLYLAVVLLPHKLIVRHIVRSLA